MTRPHFCGPWLCGVCSQVFATTVLRGVHEVRSHPDWLEGPAIRREREAANMRESARARRRRDADRVSAMEKAARERKVARMAPEQLRAHLDHANEKSRAWRAANIEAYRFRQLARSAVMRALRNGTLTRRPCEECGAEPVHAHHHNGYDGEHRLDVRWLCDKHHAQAHRTVDVETAA